MRVVMSTITGDPVLCIVIAALVTWAVHSSVASVLLIMSLAYSQFVSPYAALALVLGWLEGEAIDRTWRSPEVKDALDLCLSCKGCKHECPVRVDMATYKAEFLSHFYEHRVRPPAAYAMGFIHLWARLASSARVKARGRSPAMGDFLSRS